MDKVFFDENSRVKLPALLHFIRLGYKYQTKKNTPIDKRNNIFTNIFKDSIRKINNKAYSDSEIEKLINEIAITTDNKIDKGEAFYDRLTKYNNIKFIDLDNPEENDFHVVSELSFKNGLSPAFRPDITILINGIPLAFFEVKKPNNPGGIPSEFKRMHDRLTVSEHTHFFNQFQIIGFSNNMPYEDTLRVKQQGSFYTTPNGEKTSFNNFREERRIAVSDYISEKDIIEVLTDNSLVSIKDTPEFKTNLKVDSEANQFSTSIFSKDRIIFFIKYGIAYLNSARDGFEKHIIRYPQFFAIEEIIENMKKGMQRGVIWHTQGSGKTALSYYASKIIRDYFSGNRIVTKFYFVVDRLDLLNQATSEFSSRGMTIANIETREDFTRNIKSPKAASSGTSDGTYQDTMNIVNIQKFSEDSVVDNEIDQDIQRIYFLDEVHRSYKPNGTFLANLIASDPNAIFIGLTGTPILKEEFKTTSLFNGYIHKYYYNKSIADGYTLKIKKENISTKFKSGVKELLNIKETEKVPSKDWQIISKAPNFIEHFCNYIIEDFNQFREVIGDSSVGFMVVSSSTEQARKVQEWFEKYSSLKTALVLSEEDDNKSKQVEFRGLRNKTTGIVESKYDGVIVFNMLLTGFDAPRLKRLYLMREVKEHSLLQTLSRVNRPYGKIEYGYVVDFVDITEEYEETNKRYLDELRSDLQIEGNLNIEQILVDTEEIKRKLRDIKNSLFDFNLDNLEEFRIQIEPLNEDALRVVKNSLEAYKACYNELRIGHENVSDIPIERLSKAYTEVSNRVNIKMLERMIDRKDDQVTEIDLSNLLVEFLKGLTIDLNFTNDIDVLERVNRIQNAFHANMDKKDIEYITIREKYQSLLQKFKDKTSTVTDVKNIMDEMDILTNELLFLNSKDSTLTNRYQGSLPYMKIHKRLLEAYGETLSQTDVFEIMIDLIDHTEDIAGRMHMPSPVTIERDLRRPVNSAFKRYKIILPIEKVDEIVRLFIEERFMGYNQTQSEKTF